jgi:hypothetical protein
LTAAGQNLTPRRGAIMVAVLLAVGALLAASIGSATAQADPSAEAAIAELNTWRGEVGESPVATPANSAWNTGCEHHNNYEHLNGNELTHKEESGHPGYTSDGSESGEESVLADEFSSPAPAPDAALLPGPTWDSAVFHRVELLNPRLGHTGFNSTTFVEGSLFRSFTCMRTIDGAIEDANKTPGLALYPSPANGSYGVPTTFPAGSENPNPAGETGVPPGATLGWLESVDINGPWATAGNGYLAFAHNVTATLAPDGTLNFVPLVVSQCGPSGCGGGGGTNLGAGLQGNIGIFPTQALAQNTTYRVVLTGGTVTDSSTHTDYPIPAGYSWCFSTGATYTVSADCSPPTTARQEPSTPNASTAISITPSPAAPTATATTAAATSKARKVRCVVPKLTGKSLKVAKKKLRAAHCKVGKVHRRKGPKRRRGKAVHQSIKPGKVRPAGTKVAVTLDKG